MGSARGDGDLGISIIIRSAGRMDLKGEASEAVSRPGDSKVACSLNGGGDESIESGESGGDSGAAGRSLSMIEDLERLSCARLQLFLKP